MVTMKSEQPEKSEMTDLGTQLVLQKYAWALEEAGIDPETIERAYEESQNNIYVQLVHKPEYVNISITVEITNETR